MFICCYIIAIVALRYSGPARIAGFIVATMFAFA